MITRHVVADDRGFADDDAGGMVDEDSFSEAGGRVYVDGEDIGDSVFEEERELPVFCVPEVVGGAVGLNRLLAF